MKALTMFIMSVSSLCLLAMLHKNLLVCQLLDMTYGYSSSAKKLLLLHPHKCPYHQYLKLSECM